MKRVALFLALSQWVAAVERETPDPFEDGRPAQFLCAGQERSYVQPRIFPVRRLSFNADGKH